MVSTSGQPRSHALLRSATAAGEIAVEEYGYGLGPPDGILVLRYPPRFTVPDFPEERDDFLHQIFWSPDGVLTLNRGGTTRFASSSEMLWVRRGVVAEVRGLDAQTVLRVCVRQAPAALTTLGAAVLSPGPQVGAMLLSIARPGIAEEVGLRTRAEVLDALAASSPVEIERTAAGSSPARAVARELLRDPADPTGLGEWAYRLHVSAKTLQRDFEREFAMTFTAWRTRTRMQAAVALLHDRSVTETAHLVGYASASAFVAAFTREYGEPPGRRTGRALHRRAG